MESKKIFALVGSATKNSSNLKILEFLKETSKGYFEVDIFDSLSDLPHFNPEQTTENTPESIALIKQKIDASNGVIISCPEYIFSIPSGLKNLLEWSVSTTIFSDKPVGIIIASASGEHALKELVLIMRTLGGKLSHTNQLVINGIKGKLDANNQLTDQSTLGLLKDFMESFRELIGEL